MIWGNLRFFSEWTIPEDADFVHLTFSTALGIKGGKCFVCGFKSNEFPPFQQATNSNQTSFLQGVWAPPLAFVLSTSSQAYIARSSPSPSSLSSPSMETTSSPAYKMFAVPGFDKFDQIGVDEGHLLALAHGGRLFRIHKADVEKWISDGVSFDDKVEEMVVGGFYCLKMIEIFNYFHFLGFTGGGFCCCCCFECVCRKWSNHTV
jgi:hypothetical protein